MRHSPAISAVVLTRDQEALTRRCLEALCEADDDLEVILADNASGEAIAALAREFAGRLKLTHHRFARNLPYAVANNRAARLAQGDVLLFLNNDVLVRRDAPTRLARAVRACGGIAGAKLLFPGDGTVQHAGMKQMLWGYVSNLGTCAAASEPTLNVSSDIFAVTGAMLAIDRALFARIGGFDERYRWGYEDVDLCLKARAAGRPVRYVAEAVSVHVESATLRSSRRTTDLIANYALYRRRWNARLVPEERQAIAQLKAAGTRRVAIFGTGLAGAGLWRTLRRHDIAVEAFTASRVERRRFCGRPVVELGEVAGRSFDRLLVGTQHYFAVRDQVRHLDPLAAPILPAIEPAAA